MARRRPQAPAPVTPPSHDAPPRSFTSAGGRAFTLGPANRSTPRDPRPGVLWPIFYNGAQAGKLFQDENYGPSKPWHATIRELYWKHAADAPTGVGFDVAAFATAEQALDAWGRSADQILDWAEGKPVYTGYGNKGPQRRATESRHYPKPQSPPRRFVSPRAQEVDRTSRGRFAGKRTPAPNPGMNPFAPQAQVRLENRWQLGDVGAVYEFNVKLHRVQADVPDPIWEQDVRAAMEEFKTALKRKYPWIGETYLTGRSAGWLAVEDPEGKMTKKTLEDIAKRVESAKRQFVKDMEEAYPRKSARR